MAVAVGSAVPLIKHINNGKDYSQDACDVNAYENVMENHGSPSWYVLHKRAGFVISEADNGRTLPSSLPAPLFKQRVISLANMSSWVGARGRPKSHGTGGWSCQHLKQPYIGREG
jgi:hypothetical protein